MKLRIDPAWFATPTAQLVLIGLLAACAVGALAWQRGQRRAGVADPAPSRPASLPRSTVRDIARFVPLPAPDPAPGAPAPAADLPDSVPAGPALPRLALYAADPGPVAAGRSPAPSGRMIPCETVFPLESNRGETPLVGLVSADVWHEGDLLIPAGAEVHGRARPDPASGRMLADGAWTLSWRTPHPGEIRLEAVALARGADPDGDGSAGLPGRVLRADHTRELRLFASTFLSAATAALQEQRAVVGPLGETSVPAATVRNAALAGSSAVLRDQAQQLRETIARNGFFLRVPAGQPFTLYVTQPIPPVAHEN